MGDNGSSRTEQNEPAGVNVRRTEIDMAGSTHDGWVATFDGTETVGISREDALKRLIVACRTERESMNGRSRGSTDHSLIHRLRMKLAWWIAPFATKTGLEQRLRLIEMGAKTIQEASVTPSQSDESAKGIERRVNAIQNELGLERKYDTATDDTRGETDGE